MRGLWFAVGFILTCACASAASYDDFSKGLNANNIGNFDVAISSFSAALTAGDLAQAYVPDAHLGRARAYMRKGKCADALADLDQAIAARADYADAYVGRAYTNLCLKKPDAAAADFGTALHLRPTADLYEGYGRFLWNGGHFLDAAAAFEQGTTLASKHNLHGLYTALWYAMSADRAGTLDQTKFGTMVSKFDYDDWPAPIIDVYRGKETVEKAFKEAASRDEKKAAGQACEAKFYIAEWHLARKNMDAAKPLLQQAVAECPRDFAVYSAAQVEIKRQP